MVEFFSVTKLIHQKYVQMFGVQWVFKNRFNIYKFLEQNIATKGLMNSVERMLRINPILLAIS